MRLTNVLVVSGAARFSTRDVWEGYCRALSDEGVHVVSYPTFSMLEIFSQEQVCTDILGKALDIANGVGCVVFVDGLFFRGKRSRIPQSIRRAGIPTVLIATDDPYEPIQNADSLYTHVFTNELSCATDGAHYLPTATQLPPALPRVDDAAYDLSFVGTVFADRLPWLLDLANFCEERKLRFYIGGKFPDGTGPFDGLSLTRIRNATISAAEKWEIYSRSRVVLNLFREAAGARSPNPRVFEVAAFGHAALLTGPVRSEINEVFAGSVYEFSDLESCKRQLQKAMDDPAERSWRVRQAREIVCDGHLYDHRARRVLEVVQKPAVAGRPHDGEDRLAFLIGCGRTGSTWLSEMLGDLPGVRKWHEPYFGRMFRHLYDRPDERQRAASFYSQQHQAAWLRGARELFYQSVQDRFPGFPRHALIVKEVNTPEFFEWIWPVFRAARLIFLQRDPFDVLDSYLSLQKPGSWNKHFGGVEREGAGPVVERTALHIKELMTASLDAYERYPGEQRLLLRYEDLLQDPIPGLIRCARLIGAEVTDEQAQSVAEQHRFENYTKTGPLEFRRFGKAGSWKSSGNYTPEVTETAENLLGPLRARLGYR